MHKTQSWLKFSFLFFKKEKEKRTSQYHLRVKIELQFICIFIRFWTHNLPLHYITSKFFSSSSCGGILILPLLLTVSSFLFSLFFLFIFYYPCPSTFFSFLQHKYILVDGVNIVPNFTLMSMSTVCFILFIFDVLGLIILLRFFLQVRSLMVCN